MTEYLARGKISELWLICIGRYGAVAWVRNGLLSRKSRLGILERNSRFDWVRDSLDLIIHARSESQVRKNMKVGGNEVLNEGSRISNQFETDWNS